MFFKLALIIGSLILVDDALGRHAVQEGFHIDQKSGSRRCIFTRAELFDHRAHFTSVHSVSRAARF